MAASTSSFGIMRIVRNGELNADDYETFVRDIQVLAPQQNVGPIRQVWGEWMGAVKMDSKYILPRMISMLKNKPAENAAEKEVLGRLVSLEGVCARL